MQKLPYELERFIFLLASDSPRAIYPYLSVARRVYYWTEKILYDAVILSDGEIARRFLSCILIRPDFAGSAVKSLWIKHGVGSNTVTELLQLCKGVTSLALWNTPSYKGSASRKLVEVLNTLPLTQISLSLSLIYGGTSSESPYLPSINIFTKVTHLELLDGWVLWSSSMGIDSLHQLTHISLRVSIKRTVAPLLQALLNCRNIKVFVLRITEDHHTMQEWLEAKDIKDPRIVLVDETSSELWEGGQHTVWMYADHVVR
ncbi:hypothetical protein BJ138DRAFT_1116623 [Hygrophoropsis aurantiaca]|uniref:Uncharacterized protein n=1 Tax=Hygrophoropsis aurantiaca TaxID=72124 RepID=A0ACB8A2L5_9AGAM|nr:hypothetical protein BJ138DRAFT_1116623 [Hygrophoropsis aurantiaca]